MSGVAGILAVLLYLHQCCATPDSITFGRWEQYEACVRARAKFNGEQPLHAVVAMEDADVQLNCHECPNPILEHTLEDEWRDDFAIYKPIEGLSYAKFIEHVRREADALEKPMSKLPYAEMIDYRWERRLDAEGWTPLVPMESKKKKKLGEKSKFENPLTGREEYYRLGSYWQLIAVGVSKSNDGVYRCRNNRTGHVASIHHLSVLSVDDYPIEVQTTDSHNQGEDRDYVHLSSEESIFGRASAWTTCNKCGERGEARRRIMCYVRTRKPPVDSFGGEIPCISPHLPGEYREAAKPYLTTIEQIRSCRVECPEESKPRTRLNCAGTKNMTLEPDEYLSCERPPLHPKRHRNRVVGVKEGENTVLDCTNDATVGVIWQKEVGNTLAEIGSRLARWDRIITAQGQLVLKQVRVMTEGRYLCRTRSPKDRSSRLATSITVYAQIATG